MMLYDNFSDADATDDTDYLISRPQKHSHQVKKNIKSALSVIVLNSFFVNFATIY